jgi:arylsulfatase A-like enzyme
MRILFRMARPAALAALLACVPLACRASPAATPAAHSLVVLIVVDQLRPDYFTRFGDLPGGLGRLYRTGAVYARGMQDHAITQTAPGSATLLSGRPPASTNIFTNDRGVGDPASPLLGAPGSAGASPHRFRGTALYDWMLAADPEARVLSVSRKDRGAILPVGRSRGSVYWYSAGRFTTSTWYRDSLPAWVEAWNARGGVPALAGAAWRPLLPESAYAEPDSMPYEHQGRETAFPHWLPSDSADLVHEVSDVPWIDSLTLDFALEGARRLRLGTRGRPDLLVVSLSATDAIGHSFGPDSRELHDQILRLDHWLGEFLDSLAAVVPRERMLLALSSDHGVTPMPERSAMLGRPAGRASLGTLVRGLRERYEAPLGAGFGLAAVQGLLSADVAALRERGVNTDSLSDALAAELAARPEIVGVYTPRTLPLAPGSDVHARRWRHQLPPGHEWLFAAVLRDGWSWSGRWDAGHGTSQLDDVMVPIIFAGPGIRPARYARPVPTMDIGPTLAALLGVRQAEVTEGKPLAEVLGRTAP